LLRQELLVPCEHVCKGLLIAGGPALLPFQPLERGINPCSLGLQREVLLMMGTGLLEVTGICGIARTACVGLANRDRPVPDARVAIYPFKRSFVVGAVSTDVQSGQATMCYLPGLETPERECWYINMGAVDKDFFTTEAMVKAAP